MNGWNMIFSPVGTYGTDYLKRAAIALRGLGAIVMEDTCYPSTLTDSDGKLLNSGSHYTTHFDKGKTPPANAFWSITLYNQRQFFAANPLDRYAIGDRDALKPNADGSLDIYVQRESPGKDKESNWLPAPAEGSFSLTMRIYWPKPAAFDGTWAPPPVKRVG